MAKYDAIIIGSGPNGFAAAITLQQAGLQTLLIEGADSYGGGMRTKALTLPGFHHDVCSAIHPMALASPFFSKLPLADYGLRFTYADYEVAHPLDNQPAVLLHRDMQAMEKELGMDFQVYKQLYVPFVERWEELSEDVMGPLRLPKHPFLMGRFGLKALRSAKAIADGFQSARTRALWAGLVAHGMQPLDQPATAAIGMMLGTVAHRFGWPIPLGGSQAIADALAAYYQALGGKIQLQAWVKDMADLPSHRICILDMTPKQILKLKNLHLSNSYKKQLEAFRYGMGAFKIDWALSEATPFQDTRCQQAATVHLGNSFEEIAQSESDAQHGRLNKKPYVLFAQQSMFDSSRAPVGKQTGWAYCHVPFGSEVDMTSAIENQVERFAPGFKDTILARSVMNTADIEAYNPNYIGGDISGGMMDLRQLFTRPIRSLTPYRTSDPKVYIASASTPPGGGVHGMCGFHAARIALSDHFKIKTMLKHREK